jgi:hypothetical protein
MWNFCENDAYFLTIYICDRVHFRRGSIFMEVHSGFVEKILMSLTENTIDKDAIIFKEILRF